MIGLILCAGKGTRLKEETKDKPKCMVEVGGKPVLERVADHMNKHGIWRIVVNLHMYPEVVMKHFGQRFIYLYEPAPMGEFGTINLVRGMFPFNDLVVMNGDTITDIDLGKVLRDKSLGLNRYVHSKTKHHMGTSFIEGDSPLTGEHFVKTKCEYYDIGTPDGLKRARERYGK